MDWVYDIRGDVLGLLILAACVGFAVGGVYLTRNWARRTFAAGDAWSEHVVITLEGTFVFFGLLLALVAVAAYENYSTAREAVAGEASHVGSLYRAVSGYPEPLRSELQDELREYTRYVIEEAWPIQQKGRIPTGAITITDRFQASLYSFSPVDNGQVALHNATLLEYNELIEARGERLHNVTVGLPAALWQVLVLGAAVSIMLTWLLPVHSLRSHFLLSGAFALIVGLLLFVSAALDRPMRGDLSVSPDAFEVIERDVMGVESHR